MSYAAEVFSVVQLLTPKWASEHWNVRGTLAEE